MSQTKENLSFMGVNTQPGWSEMVGSNNRKERSPEGRKEVGSDHSRGVARVTPGEAKVYSKGLTLTRNGERKHGNTAE
jgi:hypothetical protein